MHFSSERPSDRAKVIDKKLRKELGDWLVGKPTYTSHDPSSPPPKDERTRWQKFIQSTDLAIVEEHMTVEVPIIGERTLSLTVDIGKTANTSKVVRHPVCLGLAMILPVRLSIDAAIAFDKKSRSFTGPLATELGADGHLGKQLAALIGHRYHVGATTIARAGEGVSIQPADDGAVIILNTVPQETWGGFVLRLGVRELVSAADRIERIGQDTAL